MAFGYGAGQTARGLGRVGTLSMASPVPAFPPLAVLSLAFLFLSVLSLWASPARAEDRAGGWTATAGTTVDLFWGDGAAGRGGAVLDRTDLQFDRSDGVDGGWRARIHAIHTGGDDLSADVLGDAQTASNVEAADAIRLFELWVGRGLETPRGFKAGLVDLNSEFDVQQVGGLFLNSSHGIGPDFSQSGLQGPSIFPVTALGIIGWTPAPFGSAFKAALYDAAAGEPGRPARSAVILRARDGALAVAELQRTFGPGGAGPRIYGGVWGYTARFPTLKPGFERKSRPGLYAAFETPLWIGGQGRRLDGWVRAGIADDRIWEIARYAGGGVTLSAPFAARPDDQAGLAIARAAFASDWRRGRPGGAGRAETAIEATWRFALAEGLAVQPDVQWILHPSGERGRSALALGVRLDLDVAALARRWRKGV